MRRLLFSGLLVALLLTTVGVVYAGVNWDDDPSVHIGRGYFAHIQAGTDTGVSIVWVDVWGEVDDDKAEAEGCAQFEGRGQAAVRVWITQGMSGDYPGLAGREKIGHAPRELCTRVKMDLDD